MGQGHAARPFRPGLIDTRSELVTSSVVAAVDALGTAGVLVVFVTARPPRWVHEVADQLPRSHPVAICSNGAIVYDVAESRILLEHPISPEACAAIVARLREELPTVAFAAELGLRYGQEPRYMNQWPVPPEAIVCDVESLVREPVAKLVARHCEAVEDHWYLIETIRRAVGGLGEVTSSGPEAPIEISAPGISKAFALQIVAAQHCVEREDVLAFGDMPNDIEMLAWAGYSVAPANAHADVLDVVDEVTAANDEDGVAQVLERVRTPC
ncbi:MAG: HAD family hydrolase [Acidimicrobiales bacterium]